MAETLIVKADGLSKNFGSHQILSNLSIGMAPGSVFGLVGLNGAGKTTLIRLLLGLLEPDSGTISVLGSNPWGHDPALYRQLGVVLENDGFWGALTFEQNLEIFGRAKGLGAADVSSFVREFWTGSDIVGSRKKVKFLSRGQKVQCGLCRAFLGWPKVMILDEPTVALDVKAYEHFCGLVRQARTRGAAVLISSHQLSTIEDLCDEVGILQNGALSLLDRKPSAEGQPWIIAADYNSLFAQIIKTMTGVDPQHADGRWTFAVTKPEEQIPGIIWRLVDAGCSIKEVRPAEVDLRQAIRTMFH